MTEATDEILPLTDRAPGEILFYRAGVPVDVASFLGHAAAVAARLPERRFALNLCRDRYLFLVAFAAALLRGQASLLSSDRSPRRLLDLQSRYAGLYAITDETGAADALETVTLAATLPESDARSAAVPQIAGTALAAIVFTSGSTGMPVANEKPWAALVRCSRAAAARFLAPGGGATIIATVPPQHMYGFETSVLLPLHGAVASYAGNTFFPQDVAEALTRSPAPRWLVTTPLQLRALRLAAPALPPLAGIISATAPLAAETAREIEAGWQTRVFEIFGATEVGSIASRRTAESDVWDAYDSVTIRRAGDEALVRVAALPAEIPLNDVIEWLGPARFRLLGRKSDVVKLAGKRASLGGLNRILAEIEGVEDGVFIVPDDLESNPTSRLAAAVVAPNVSSEQILAALRERVESVFLPRRIIKVGTLPRNEVGKIPHAALAGLRQTAKRA